MPFSFRQWFFLILFSILVFTTSSIHTLHALFFRSEAKNRHVSTPESSVVFGVFDLAAFISSPIIGSFLPVFGVKPVICISTFLQSFSVILFGTLGAMRAHWLFIACALLLRLCEGIGFMGTMVAVYSLIPSEFPTAAVSLIYGVINMWFIVGTLSGPSIGELLYDIGGFLCPFMTMGVALVSISIFLPLIFWKSPLYPPTGEKGNFFQLFRKPLTLLNFLVLGIVMMLMIFLYSSLSFFLTKTFDLHQAGVGWTSGMVVAAQAVTSPLWGYLSRGLVSTQIIIFTGGLLSVIGSILIGPLPLFGIQPSLASTCFGLVLLSSGISALFLASFLCAAKETIRYGFLDNTTTTGMVSAGFLGMMFLGEAIGSLLSGLFDETVGFKGIPYAIFALSLLIFGLNVSYTGGSVFKGLCKKKDVEGDSLLRTGRPPANETSSLLKNPGIAFKGLFKREDGRGQMGTPPPNQPWPLLKNYFPEKPLPTPFDDEDENPLYEP